MDRFAAEGGLIVSSSGSILSNILFILPHVIPAKESTKQLTPMSIRNLLVMINNDAPNPSNSVEVEAVEGALKTLGKG